MLHIDNHFLEIETAIEELAEAFLDLEVVSHYRQAQKAFLADDSLQKEIALFQKMNEEYTQQKAFIKFRPEVRQLRKELLAQKRQLDINDKVVRMRRAEVELQETLAELTQEIACSVSPDIFVDTGLPLAPHKPLHKKGRGNNIKER
ncbi:YlbF family regulator [Streptococcus macacae]|nr:YlbF family regulator [Streptococcus macacae]SUN78044.1 Regulatory protein ylbF [Streptococcus macacae NCTC 11558]